MVEHNAVGTAWLAFGGPGAAGVTTFVTTRAGGVSSPPYEALNIGFGVGDDAEAVAENRRRAAEAVGVPLQLWVLAEQVHGANVAVVSADQAGAGTLDPSVAVAGSDALISTAPVCLVVRVADCVPLLYWDPARRAIGAAHAGWRGTVAGIAAATVSAMAEAFGTRVEDLWVGLGPSICGDCYEVSGEVAEAVCRATPGGEAAQDEALARRRVDLAEANRRQLVQAGVSAASIELSGLCTRCEQGRFFSARAAGGPTGRFAVGIARADRGQDGRGTGPRPARAPVV